MNEDKNDCSVYAVAFLCCIDPGRARYWLGRAGRQWGEGATDTQIRLVIKKFGGRLCKRRSEPRTIRTFAREHRWGAYLVTTCDHVVAIIDGNVCHRTSDPEVTDLQRIERVDKISFDMRVS